jgi:hypothetical protein
METDDRATTEGRGAGWILLILYTVSALIVLPFATVLALYTPLLVGSASKPDGPIVVFVTLALLVLPLLLLVGPIGAWIAWLRRRQRAAWTYALLPVAYGSLVMIWLTIFVG